MRVYIVQADDNGDILAVYTDKHDAEVNRDRPTRRLYHVTEREVIGKPDILHQPPQHG